MDRLQAMNTFVAVVDAGSFVGAMEPTGLSKPAVSRQVADLEQHLGIRLLHRTTRRLSLTDEGRLYYLRCKEVLAAVREAEDEAGARATQAHGRLRIGAPHDFGILHLASLWAQFMALNPQVEMDIVLSDRVVDLVEEGYDLVVRIGNLSASGLVARPLAQTRMVLCAAPAYLERHGTPAHPEELARHAIISYSYSSHGDDWRFTHADGQRSGLRIQPRAHANSGSTCLALALAGQGIILQPDFLSHAALASGALVELMPQWQAGTISVHAVYPTRTLLPLKVQLLRDFLIGAFESPPWHNPDSIGQRG